MEKGEGPVPTNRINAGAYVVDRDVVETMIRPGGPSPSSAKVFPLLAGHGLYGYETDGYWVDIGQPQRYLEQPGTCWRAGSSRTSRRATRPVR